MTARHVTELPKRGLAKDGQVIVIVNGQKLKFSDYSKKQNKHFQRMLVIHMIKSGESLDWVVDQLINGQVI